MECGYECNGYKQKVLEDNEILTLIVKFPKYRSRILEVYSYNPTIFLHIEDISSVNIMEYYISHKHIVMQLIYRIPTRDLFNYYLNHPCHDILEEIKKRNIDYIPIINISTCDREILTMLKQVDIICNPSDNIQYYYDNYSKMQYIKDLDIKIIRVLDTCDMIIPIYHLIFILEFHDLPNIIIDDQSIVNENLTIMVGYLCRNIGLLKFWNKYSHIPNVVRLYTKLFKHKIEEIPNKYICYYNMPSKKYCNRPIELSDISIHIN